MAATIERAGNDAAGVGIESKADARRPTIDDVWMAVAVGGPTLLGLLGRLPTIDLAYHLRLGSLIVAEGAIPRTDFMTFTAGGRPWMDQQWGAQAVLAIVHEAGGFPALVVFRAALVATLAACIVMTCRARGATGPQAAALTIGAYIVAMPHLAVRPQLLGAVLFAACVCAITVRRRHPWIVWVVPLLTMIWANLHGSFVLAIAVAAYALVEDLLERRDAWRTTACAALATVVATGISPFGASVWTYAIAIGTNPTIRASVEEWRPPTIETLGGGLFLVALLALGGLLARRGRRLGWLALLWVGGLSLLGLMAQRNVLWWAIGVPVVAASMLSSDRGPVRRSSPRGARIAHVAVLASICFALVVAMPWFRPDRRLVTQVPSQASLETVEGHLRSGDRLFVDQTWASWVELTVPDVPVFVDSRIELFPEDVWNDYRVTIVAVEGWSAVLDRWSVDAVLVPSSRAALIDGLSADPSWDLAYESDDEVVFVRQ